MPPWCGRGEAAKEKQKNNMSNEIEVQWKADSWILDGTIQIEAEEVEDYETADEAMEQVVWPQVLRDFEQNVRCVYDNFEDVKQAIEEAIAARKEREAETESWEVQP